uniref:Alternative protein TAF4B n=1 Tax=Homo sapiens TaxID=9606 RepID=L0R5D1_HUMAN|nr:alternative protein TAF4B [Homo sapiens]
MQKSKQKNLLGNCMLNSSLHLSLTWFLFLRKAWLPYDNFCLTPRASSSNVFSRLLVTWSLLPVLQQ